MMLFDHAFPRKSAGLPLRDFCKLEGLPADTFIEEFVIIGPGITANRSLRGLRFTNRLSDTFGFILRIGSVANDSNIIWNSLPAGKFVPPRSPNAIDCINKTRSTKGPSTNSV
jgi:hypothetical protein